MDINSLAKKIELPEESRAALENTLASLLRMHEFEMEKMRDEYIAEGDFNGFKLLDSFAEEADINKYTASLAFLLYCALSLKRRYEENGLSDELYFDTMRDLKYKNDECVAVKGVTGTFVRDWFRWFFQLKRFALGRFQYETVKFGKEAFTVNGLTVLPGDSVINIHIPFSGVPITSEIRLASYKKAYEFYRDKFDKHEIPFICYSWLLYNGDGFFPKNGNIYSFQNDFHIIASAEDKLNEDAWRLFLTDTTDYTSLPEKSSLQRHIKKLLLEGKCFGEGTGVFFFDGTSII